jgi:hypothetical protein
MVLLILVLSGTPVKAAFESIIVEPVYFDDFYYDDPGVSFTADTGGNKIEATLDEDPSLGTVLLSNDSLLGDPGIPVPPGVLTLEFDYHFVLGSPPNNDSFYAKVFDGDSGTVLHELSVLTTTDSAHSTWDLSSIDPNIMLLGLEFQLNSYNDFALGSQATVGNVHMTYVPVPPPVILLGSGLPVLLCFRWRVLSKRNG